MNTITDFINIIKNNLKNMSHADVVRAAFVATFGAMAFALSAISSWVAFAVVGALGATFISKNFFPHYKPNPIDIAFLAGTVLFVDVTAFGQLSKFAQMISLTALSSGLAFAFFEKYIKSAASNTFSTPTINEIGTTAAEEALNVHMKNKWVALYTALKTTLNDNTPANRKEVLTTASELGSRYHGIGQNIVNGIIQYTAYQIAHPPVSRDVIITGNTPISGQIENPYPAGNDDGYEHVAQTGLNTEHNLNQNEQPAARRMGRHNSTM